MSDGTRAIVEGTFASVMMIVVMMACAAGVAFGYEHSSKEAAAIELEREHSVTVMDNEPPEAGRTTTMLLRHEGVTLTCEVSALDDEYSMSCAGPEGPVSLSE